MFYHISKHLGVCQKYSATRRIFSLFPVSENVTKHGLSYIIKAQYETRAASTTSSYINCA